MPKSTFAVQKVSGKLVPLTSADSEMLSHIREGDGFRVQLVRISDRSIQHHRLYFGGLVALVADYWSPADKHVSEYDKKVMNGLIDWLEERALSSESFEKIVEIYLSERAQNMASKYESAYSGDYTLVTVHEWLKEIAGYYDVVWTPSGLRRKTHSINFNAMSSQIEFNEFYDRVFQAAWDNLLQRGRFKSKEEAMQVALRMSKLGSSASHRSLKYA